MENTKKPAVFAAADIGSNATKILFWEVAESGLPRERFQKRYPLRLSDAFRAGWIGPPLVARLIETFTEIAAICQQQGARQVQVVATEAFRSARNASDVVQAIALETGIEPRVVSFEEEGRLTAEGVLLDCPDRRGQFPIVDIGGGSAQIIVPDRKGAVRTLSLPLGAVRLREMFIHSDPLTPADFAAMQTHVETVARRDTTGLTKDWVTYAVGCGGGVRFLHVMCGILCGTLSQSQPIRLDQLEHLCQTIWPMSVASLVRNYGIDDERAEIIVPGAVALLTLTKCLKVSELRPSSRGVRDGLLADFLRRRT